MSADDEFTFRNRPGPQGLAPRNASRYIRPPDDSYADSYGDDGFDTDNAPPRAAAPALGGPVYRVVPPGAASAAAAAAGQRPQAPGPYDYSDEYDDDQMYSDETFDAYGDSGTDGGFARAGGFHSDASGRGRRAVGGRGVPFAGPGSPGVGMSEGEEYRHTHQSGASSGENCIFASPSY